MFSRARSTALAVLGVLALAAVAALFSLSGPPSPAAATVPEGSSDAGVSVSGVGKVTGTPDVLRATVGVEVQGDDVPSTLARANEAAAKVIAALKDRGVADADLQTANLSIYPRYDDEGREVTGYVVHQDVSVTLRDLDSAGATIGAAVEAGGNAARLSGVSFSLEDDEDLLVEARKVAFARARATAEQLAELAGKELGDVVAIREGVEQRPPQPFAFDSAAGGAESAAAIPIQPGTADVIVTVDVRWALR